MVIINPTDFNKIDFDEIDIEIFKDVRERVQGRQDPLRLVILFEYSMNLITAIYGVKPYSVMATIHALSNNQNAATNGVFTLIRRVGLSSKWRNPKKDQALVIQNASGRLMHIHPTPTRLTFDVLSEGRIRVVFCPFTTSVEPSFFAKVRQEMLTNFDLLSMLFKDFRIYYNNSKIIENSDDFYKLIVEKDSVTDIHSLYFCTDAYFFPTNFKDGAWNLRRAFVCLYPLLDLCIAIANDQEYHLDEMLNKLTKWKQVISLPRSETLGESQTNSNIVNLPKDNVVDFKTNKSVFYFSPEDYDLREFEFWQPKLKLAETVVIDPNVKITTGYQKEIVNEQSKQEIEEAWKEVGNLTVESLEEFSIDRNKIESKLEFNPENFTDARERTNRTIVQRQGQSKFRSELLKAYGGKCAITDCDAEAALEAAHIYPYLGTDTNHVTNGLLLRADIHTLFDLYLISINPDISKVVISSSLLNTSYKELNGKPLKSPQNCAASPSPQALARHYESFLLKQNN